MEDFNKMFEEHRIFLLPKHTKLTTKIITDLDNLLQFAPPEDLRNTLLEIYHTYIIQEHETLPANFKRMANDLYFIINFLNNAEKEYQKIIN